MTIDLVYYTDGAEAAAFARGRKAAADVALDGVAAIKPLDAASQAAAAESLRSAARRHASKWTSAAIAVYVSAWLPRLLELAAAVDQGADLLLLRLESAAQFHLALRHYGRLRVSRLRGERLEPHEAKLRDTATPYRGQHRAARLSLPTSPPRLLVFDSGATPIALRPPLLDTLADLRHEVLIATARRAVADACAGLPAVLLEERDVQIFGDPASEVPLIEGHDPIDALLRMAFTSATMPELGARLAAVAPLDFAVWTHVVTAASDPPGKFVEFLALGAGCEVVRLDGESASLSEALRIPAAVLDLPPAPSLADRLREARRRNPRRSDAIRVFYYPSREALTRFVRQHARDDSIHFADIEMAFARPLPGDDVEQCAQAFANMAVTVFVAAERARPTHLAWGAQGYIQFRHIDENGGERAYPTPLLACGAPPLHSVADAVRWLDEKEALRYTLG